MTDENDPQWAASWAGDVASDGTTVLPTVWGDTKVIQVRFPDLQWEPNDAMDDPGAQLRGPVLVVNGLPLHMEAWAVTYDEEGMQQGAEEWVDDFEKLHEAVHADGSFSTMTLNGREYIVICTPFC